MKGLVWMSTSKEDLKKMPKFVQKDIGFSLHRVQEGKTPANAKPLKGMGSGVMEIVSDYNKSTYRAVYVLKLGDEVYILHAFQKKSKTGIKTPQKEIDLIRQRLAAAKKEAKLK